MPLPTGSSRSNQRGSLVVQVLILLPVLIALVGLVLDGGFAARQVLQLEAAVDAASRAATDAYDRGNWDAERRVVIDEAEASQLAEAYLARNMPAARLVEAQVLPGGTNRVQVTATVTVRFAFMKIVGVRETEVSRSAVAKKW